MNTLCFYTNGDDLEKRKKLMIPRESDTIAGTMSLNSQDGLVQVRKQSCLLAFSGNMGTLSGG